MSTHTLASGETAYKLLEEDLESYLDAEPIKTIAKAYQIANEAHTGQKRHSGEDYITHPVAVARILAQMHMDHQSVAAALLHDVIEDTTVDKDTIVKEFGERVALLVDGVSKLTQMKFESHIEAQAENFRKMLLAMAKDIRVILIKLADRLHNMRTLGVLRPEKRRRIARETLEIYAPIANRLGMHRIWVEFEDLGFAALHPLRHKVLHNAVKQARGNRKEIMDKIAKELAMHLDKIGLKINTITGREKHLYSIYKKMRNKKIPFTEIMDVYAFRIVVDKIDTCYRVLGAVHQLYKPVAQRFKDYIAIPKINNYQSLHTTLFGPYGVPIEIQIRTSSMHQEAEDGIAAHWLYKSDNFSPDDAQVKARSLLKGLFELQENTKSPVEFIENVKIDLFPDEVYVFTPRGEIKELPSGATAVDFAYSVHSDIGNSCIAAKINRRLAPLSTVLRNGQTIEIVTAPGARPNPAWLNFVVTSKARSNIRYYIREQRRSESKNLGKELLEKALKDFGKSINDFTDRQLKHILKNMQYYSMHELYESIGLGNQLPIAVAKELVEQAQTRHKKLKTQEVVSNPLIIKGSKGMVVNFADCCYPIPGDPIVGVFSSGIGLMIHNQDCEHIAKLVSKPDKIVNVQWEENISGEFTVKVIVEVVNQRGVLAKVAGTISQAEANIENVHIDSEDNRYNKIKLTLTVKNRVHLARVMRRLRALHVVVRFYRTR
ncbi:MAG: RelA/SpoT family protein [Pseudomonadota bacterium]